MPPLLENRIRGAGQYHPRRSGHPRSFLQRIRTRPLEQAARKRPGHGHLGVQKIRQLLATGPAARRQVAHERLLFKGRRAFLRGGALYRPDGSLIGRFGERPRLTPGLAESTRA